MPDSVDGTTMYCSASPSTAATALSKPLSISITSATTARAPARSRPPFDMNARTPSL